MFWRASLMSIHPEPMDIFSLKAVWQIRCLQNPLWFKWKGCNVHTEAWAKPLTTEWARAPACDLHCWPKPERGTGWPLKNLTRKRESFLLTVNFLWFFLCCHLKDYASGCSYLLFLVPLQEILLQHSINKVENIRRRGDEGGRGRKWFSLK